MYILHKLPHVTPTTNHKNRKIDDSSVSAAIGNGSNGNNTGSNGNNTGSKQDMVGQKAMIAEDNGSGIGKYRSEQDMVSICE